MKANNYKSIRNYIKFGRTHRWQAAVVLLLFVLADLLIAVVPIYIGRLVGAASAIPLNRHDLITNMWILVLLSFCHTYLWHGAELVYLKYLNRLPYDYEASLFKRVIDNPYPYFVDKFTGKLSSYLDMITVEIRNFTEAVFYNYTAYVVNVITLFFIVLKVNWQTGLIFILGSLFMLLVGKHTVRNSIKYEKQFTDVSSNKNAKVIDVITNFMSVKSFRKENLEYENISKSETATIMASRNSFKWSVFFWASMSTVVRNIIWPATIVVNVYLLLNHQLSIAQFATVLSTLLLFSASVWEIIWHISQFNLRMARAEEAYGYLFKYSSNIATGATPLGSLKEEIEFVDLGFAYPDKPEQLVLENINLKIKLGQKIGVVGRSGSGKTTLTKLLLGYYPATTGSIRVDGATVNSNGLGGIVSYVPQDTSLFHRTIADNIAYAGDHEATLEDIIRASKLAHAHEFISKINNSYQALVGERGIKLSAGQRQRIAIARAILDNKSVLILDEATSALDSESEILVQKGLEALWHNKTVIAIAHRLSTLRHMDKIIVMDKGKIVEFGSHNELLAQNGAYAKLWQHQSGGFLEE